MVTYRALHLYFQRQKESDETIEIYDQLSIIHLNPLYKIFQTNFDHKYGRYLLIISSLF